MMIVAAVATSSLAYLGPAALRPLVPASPSAKCAARLQPLQLWALQLWAANPRALPTRSRDPERRFWGGTRGPKKRNS